MEPEQPPPADPEPLPSAPSQREQDVIREIEDALGPKPAETPDPGASPPAGSAGR